MGRLALWFGHRDALNLLAYLVIGGIMKNKTVYNIPVQIDGRTVADIWIAHGTSDSTIATLAMSNANVISALGDWGGVESVSSVPYQAVNIITKPLKR